MRAEDLKVGDIIEYTGNYYNGLVTKITDVVIYGNNQSYIKEVVIKQKDKHTLVSVGSTCSESFNNLNRSGFKLINREPRKSHFPAWF